MKISSLRAKARRNTLEVEHILVAAKARTPGLKDELQRLSREFDWSSSTHLPDGKHVVPLAKWGEIAGVYADGGIAALSDLAKEPENAHYIIGMLEELRSREAVDALISLFQEAIHSPQNSVETAWRLTRAFNQLLSIKGAVIPTEDQAASVRTFLESFYAKATSVPQRAWVVYALRGVGNQSSLDLLASIPDFQRPYQDTRTEAIRTIRKKLRA